MNRQEIINEVVTEISKEKKISEHEVGTYDVTLKLADRLVNLLTIPVVSVSLPDDDEIEKRAEYMQRPRNTNNDNKEEFIYGYMYGAEWIINKVQPE